MPALTPDPTVNYPAFTGPYWQTVNAIWPGLVNQQAVVSPPRNGMNRETGKLMQGWPHVKQSMELIFYTPFHQRVLRRWVGSFVPMILGETYVERIVLRFFWSIASSIDLWEPDYRIRQVYFMGPAVQDRFSPPLTNGATEALFRLGQAIFRTEGVFYPRGHLGDYTPYQEQHSAITSPAIWDRKPA